MKKNVLNRLSGIVALVLLSFNGFGHPKSDKSELWMNALTKAYRKEEANINQTLSNKKAWYLKYTISSVMKMPDGKIQNIESNGEMMASNKVKYARDDKMEILMDESDVFTISKAERIITHTLSSKEELLLSSKMNFDFFNDSLIKLYEVTDCKEVDNAGNGRLIRYDVESKDVKKNLIQQMIFYFDDVNGMRKVHVVLNPAFSGRIVEYTFIIREKGQKTLDDTWLPVRKRVLTTTGNPLSAYKNYQYKNFCNKNSH